MYIYCIRLQINKHVCLSVTGGRGGGGGIVLLNKLNPSRLPQVRG